MPPKTLPSNIDFRERESQQVEERYILGIMCLYIQFVNHIPYVYRASMALRDRVNKLMYFNHFKH